ncbi:hypothetical protein Moror_16222 [Moniliophthora roreri MCA 2997]|uniref:Cytochrome c oxidase assembly factor 3 mitochondrial coiled-coil domain-containing protein n=1 Tax=Moniliophthora roreri (strain MCA 2997) TaxID=1381753 RepID=V2YCG1_MONRO|nr:hypothetical protein Moror_16222 [Moniliophthora roreri MCA 2997]
MEERTNRMAQELPKASIETGSIPPGLIRARQPQPFLAKNVATGAILGALAIGVYVYSTVRQVDNINEEARNKVPEAMMKQPVAMDEEGTAMTRAAGAVVEKLKAYTETTYSAKDNTVLNSFDIARSIAEEVVEDADTWPQPSKLRGRGLLVGSFMDKQYPWLLDPQGKTLVWGAPPIDNIGFMQSSHC